MVTVKLAIRQSVISGHNISMKEIGSKEEVSALHFVLDTCREQTYSVLFLWQLHSTLVLTYSSSLLISYPSL